MIEEGEERVVETVDVEQKYRFLMELESLPGKNFEHLFEGAETAGKDEEGVGLFAYEGFAGVHGVGDVELGDALVGNLEIDQNLWDDAYDAASSGKARLGYRRHEADGSSAVDEPNVFFGESAAELFGCFAVDGIVSVGRGAEDGYVLNHL